MSGEPIFILANLQQEISQLAGVTDRRSTSLFSVLRVGTRLSITGHVNDSTKLTCFPVTEEAPIAAKGGRVRRGVW